MVADPNRWALAKWTARRPTRRTRRRSSRDRCHLRLYQTVTAGCDNEPYHSLEKRRTMRNEAFERRTRGRGRRTLAAIAAVGVFGTVSTTTSASVPPRSPPLMPQAKRATFVYTVSDDGDFLWPEGIAVQDNTYYVYRLRQRHDLPRRSRRAGRGRGVHPRCRLRPQAGSRLSATASSLLAWLRRGVGLRPHDRCAHGRRGPSSRPVEA